MQGDEPLYLPVGTAVSAKYKGAFCEAKVSKVVRIVKCKVTFKMGLGTSTVNDEQIRGPLRIGQIVQVKHPDHKEYIDATLGKIQDCSQYTVVFDDGDITTLRRTALCLKSGRHFNESETLDQLPLTHPEHFGNPVMVRGRGRRSRQFNLLFPREDSSEGETEEGNEPDLEQYSVDTGKVVCIEAGDKKRNKDNWFPGLIVMPSAQPTVRINVKDEFLVRSFKDGRYYTVPKKEVTEFKREMAARVESPPLAEAVEKAIKYLDNDELPAHWEKNCLFHIQSPFSDSDENLTDSSDDEPTEEKDHFVAQLYKFMDDSATPLNKTPTIGNKDVDLYRLFRLVHKLGGYNRVTNQNKWKAITLRLKFAQNQNTYNQVKLVYKKCLLSYESFYRTLGCTMLNPTRNAKKNRGRALIRDKDRVTPVQSPRPPEKEEEEPKKEEIKKDSKREEKRMEVSDNSSDAMDQSEQPSTSKEPARSKRCEPRPKKMKMATGEKVKSLVEKFEEQGKKEDEKEEKVQQTRSQLPRKEVVSPERRQRETKTPLREPLKVQNKLTTKKVKEDEDKDKKRGRKRGNNEEKNNSDSSVNDAPTPIPPPTATAPPPTPPTSTPPSTPSTSTSAVASTSGSSSITSGSSVNIGDKLKVYYGPTHESKVTYEAKVLEIDKDPNGQFVYLVHYTGWNTRYDEWIAFTRIAENLSATTKAKKLKQGSSGSKSKPAAKRGRGMSITGRSTVPEAPPARSTTPSSVTSSSSRTKSPATPASRSGSRVTRQDSSRRTRRTSVQTDVSVHSESESDERSESESELSRTRSGTKSEDSAEPKTYRRKLIKSKNDKRKKEDDDTEKEEEPERPKRLRKLKKISPDSKSALDSDDEASNQPKGREFDLNQIRSELKGIGKTIKVTDSSEKENASSDESSTLPDPKENNSENEPEPEKEKEKVVEKDSEDIYEFKEPEPFEYESRKIEDKGGKKRIPRLYDEVEKSPKKKSPKSPAKVEAPKETPEKRFRRTPVKKVEVEEEEEKKEEKKIEDAFDKLVDSPSFHIGKTSEEKVEKPSVAKVLNMDEPLSIFELPENMEENSEDRLELSDSEEQQSEVRFTHVAPLFLHSNFGKSSPSENLLIETEVFNKVEEEEVKNSEDDEEIAASIQRVIEQTISDDSTDLLEGEVKIETITLNRAEVEDKTEEVVEEKQVVLSKQIASVFQETDSSLLEDLYSKPQFKADFSDFKEINVKTGTKIADTILRKLNKIDVKTVEVVEVEEEDKKEVKLELEEAPKVEVKIEEEAEIKEIEGYKKRKKGFVSKEYIEETDSDTDSDSEQRLVIARSDDDSQTSLPPKPDPDIPPAIPAEEERNFKFDDIKIEEEVAEPPPEEPQSCEEIKDEEPDSHLHSMLLCEETIPGSPAPAPTVEPPPPKKQNKTVLEMPFASAPSGSSSANKILLEQKTAPNQPSPVPLVIPLDTGEASVLDNTPPTTPESTLSNLSPRREIEGLSPNTADNESCKSTEPEQEYITTRRTSSKIANYSEEDSLMNIEAATSSRKSREDVASPCKKRRRSCKAESESATLPLKRGRKPNRSRQNSDSDDTSEHSMPGMVPAHIETRLSRSPRPSKYNFFVELDPNLDSAARIAVLQQKLQELRTTYADVRAQLVTIERRRKKIRRREREALKAAKQEMTCT